MISYDDYVSIYGADRMPMEEFNRISIRAARIMDIYTTGADGFHKLLDAFPTNEHDAMIVKACACQICDMLYQMGLSERNSIASKQLTQTENGLKGGVISSVSAGNESISYSTSGETVMDKAAGDLSLRRRAMQDIIREYLSGVTDANGVNLLYMGKYPRG